MARVIIVTDANIDRAVSEMSSGPVIIAFVKSQDPTAAAIDEGIKALLNSEYRERLLIASVYSARLSARMLGVPDDGVTTVVILERDAKAQVSHVKECLEGSPDIHQIREALAS